MENANHPRRSARLAELNATDSNINSQQHIIHSPHSQLSATGSSDPAAQHVSTFFTQGVADALYTKSDQYGTTHESIPKVPYQTPQTFIPNPNIAQSSRPHMVDTDFKSPPMVPTHFALSPQIHPGRRSLVSSTPPMSPCFNPTPSVFHADQVQVSQY